MCVCISVLVSMMGDKFVGKGRSDSLRATGADQCRLSLFIISEDGELWCSGTFYAPGGFVQDDVLATIRQ